MSIEMPMAQVRLSRISGTALNSDGKPMSGAMVMLMPTMKDAVALMPGGTSRTDKDGNFNLSGVAPGEYSIQAQSLAALMGAASEAMAMIGGGEAAPTPAAKPQALEREFATANVVVVGDDINGLMITGTRGAKATGKIVFEGGQKPENVTSLRMVAAPTDQDTMPAAASMFGNAKVTESGTFEIDGLVGGRAFRLANPPKGWHLKRITHDNDDITDKGFNFKPGEDVEGFTIELTTKAQTITGAVSDDKGTAVKEYTVVVFPEDSEKWTMTNTRWMSSARADQQGQFKIENLPPGRYLAAAVEYVPQGEWMDPEWLARAVKDALKFTLDEGAVKTLDLKLLKL
jgi:protocatechuate 3,4-dioxygenase beta subunit